MNYFMAGFMLDWGNPDFGHLTNILAPGPGEWSPGDPHYPYSEIGIGLLTNVTPTVAPGVNPIAANDGLNVGPDIVTQEFGWRSGNPILTGTMFVDKAGTGFYAIGEGLGGVTITAVGTQGQGTFRTQTWGSGGYSLPLPPGTYAVTATGGPTRLSTTVTLGIDNVSWELAFKPAPAATPTPTPAPVSPVTPTPTLTPAPTPTPKPKTAATPTPSPKPAAPTKLTPPKATPPPKATVVTVKPLAPVVTKHTTTTLSQAELTLLLWRGFV